jgi:hypothetical protein
MEGSGIAGGVDAADVDDAEGVTTKLEIGVIEVLAAPEVVVMAVAVVAEVGVAVGVLAGALCRSAVAKLRRARKAAEGSIAGSD